MSSQDIEDYLIYREQKRETEKALRGLSAREHYACWTTTDVKDFIWENTQRLCRYGGCNRCAGLDLIQKLEAMHGSPESN